MDSTRRLEQLIPATSEAAYDRLTCYRFASDTSRGKTWPTSFGER